MIRVLFICHGNDCRSVRAGTSNPGVSGCIEEMYVSEEIKIENDTRWLSPFEIYSKQ